MTRLSSFIALTVFIAANANSVAAKPVSVELATDGQARLPIVVSKDASERVRAAANELANYLQRISNAEFKIQEGDGAHGIALGLASDFSGSVPPNWLSGNIKQREHYLLRSHQRGVWLFGATELAIEHAVWDLLYRIGYRQYFPGDNWEVIPRHPTLSIAVDVEQSPDYLGRRIWYGYGLWDYNAKPYERWCVRNRCVNGIELSTGHAYDTIVRALRPEFEKHPEYWPLLDRKRGPVRNPKPGLGNANVRALIVEHALKKLKASPTIDSVSMDPSDGGGWCQCEKCAKLGSVSDQAVTLANEVASALEEKYSDKLVGMYAYNYHSPPPELRVHPNVVISVATSFIKGGLTLDEIIRGWGDRGATLGIREYYGVNVWDRDMPARARGGNIEYLKRTIPEFHAKGARFMSAESSDNWGPNGLGYYLAARMLWDVDEAERVDELAEDFLEQCFGKAKEPMREFYRQLDSSRPHLVFDDQLGRMFRSLNEARKIAMRAQQSRVTARVNDLILYARHVDLFRRYTLAKGTQRQTAFEAMIRHAYRMRQTMMVHSKALYRDVVARDKQVSIPKDATWSVPESENPWKSSEPFKNDELMRFISDGIERYSLLDLDFEPVQFSEDLVPATPLQLDNVKSGTAQRGRGTRVLFCYVDNAPSAIKLKITGGLIAHYRDRGNVRVDLWKIGGASQTGEQETLVASDRSVPPDGKPRTISLQVKEPGLHKLQIADGGDHTSVEWKPGTRFSYRSTVDQPIKTHGRWTLYFYVPRNTKVVGLHGGSYGTITNADGEEVFSLNGRKTSFYSIPVANDQSGRLWRINHAAGGIRLLTVPPYLARSAEELLLPREVVERDKR